MGSLTATSYHEASSRARDLPETRVFVMRPASCEFEYWPRDLTSRGLLERTA